MCECPLCNGMGTIPENKIHFGDSMPQNILCPACRGTCQVEILLTSKRTITIIKPHGIWQSDNFSSIKKSSSPQNSGIRQS